MTLQLEPVRNRLDEPMKGEVAFVWLCRILALYALLQGVAYAAKLIGFTGTPFDALPLPWQIAGLCLAVLLPSAGIGLWLLSSWGGVLWCACACAEVLMYSLYAETFGARPFVVAFDLAVSLAYAALGINLFLQERRKLAENN